MADTIGRGVIEIVADARKLKAGIDDAKRSIRTLGEGQKDISKSAQQSIDRYIGKLQQQNAVLGKSVRETELYKLALRGASNEQIKAADSALRFRESYDKAAVSARALRTGLVALGTIAVTGLIAAAAVFDRLAKQAGDFQDMGEKVGDTAENIASLAVAAGVGGTSMQELVAASVKLTKGLQGVDDETKAAGAAIVALGLNLQDFRQLAPVDQIEAIAKALAGFADGPEKTAAAVALFGKAGAEMLPFLRELAGETGRQNILTSEQIRLADQYSDSQRRLKSQISLYAGAIASEMVPAFNDLLRAFLDVIKGIGGVEQGIKGLGNSSDIQAFAESAVRALAVVVDYVQVLARGFQIVGRLIAANVAFHMSLLSGEFKQALKIYEMAAKDIKDIATRPLFSTRLDERIAARKAGGGKEADKPDDVRRPRLKFDGAIKAEKDAAKAARDKAEQEARQEAAATLAFDLAQIKKASDATIGAFANAERIMGAMRSAGLVADKDYYASKLGFIRLNSQEQEAALQLEIARLQRETFAGKTAAKDRIDNQTKIADAEAKIAKIRADATAQITVNSIEEDAALKRIAQDYVDATKAAQAYIDTINRQNEREIAGIGRGEKFRENQAGISAIEDKQIEARQRLESELRKKQIDRSQFDDYLAVVNDTYAKEIAAYRKRTDTLEKMQGDWINGATDALQDYYDESQNIAAQTDDLFANSFQGAEDALVDFVTTGKADFKGLVDSILKDMTRMFIKQSITGPLANWMQGAIGGTQTAAPISEGVSSIGGTAGAAASTEAAVALKSVAESSKVTTFALKEFADDGVAGATQQMFENVSAGVIEQTAEQAATSSLASLTVSANLAAAALASVAAQKTAGAIAGAVQSSAGGYAEGGQIRGPGSGTSDSIPVLLSDKEFVVRADKTTKPGALKFLNTVNEHGVAAAMNAALRNAGREKFASGGQALKVLAFGISGAASREQVVEVVSPAGASIADSDDLDRESGGAAFGVAAQRFAAGGLVGGAGAVLGSYANGINFVPQTGVYQLHKGERVTPAASAGWGGAPSVVVNQSFAPGTDKRTINQAASAAGRAMQHAMRKNG
jgi:lambda family phage tail tape measure protein